MYNQCLITSTLLDSYEFAVGAPQSWKVRAENGFLAKLRREKVDYPAWVKAGQDFEDTVYRVCNAHRNDRFKDDPIKTGSQHFRDVCAMCIGGTFQQKLSKKIKVGDNDVFLFGYTDVSFPTSTLDLKTTLKYKGPDKYLNGHQHLLYSYMRNVHDFDYVVVQWEDETTSKIQAVHEIAYTVDDMQGLEQIVHEKIAKFFEYLRANGLWLDYWQVFSKN